MKNKKHIIVCVSRFLALLEMTAMQKGREKRLAAAKPPLNALSHQAKRHVERSETSFSNSLQFNNFKHQLKLLKMKRLLFFAALCSMGSMAAHAQSAAGDGKTYISVNVGHMTLIPMITTAMYGANVIYLPIHFNAYHSLSKNFAMSGMAIYRMERDYDFLTQEVGFAIGPCFTSNHLKGFFADFKVGYAFAFGHDYQYNDYSRSDFVLQPEVGYFLTLAGRFTMSLGLGCQSLLKIREYPRREDTGWDWDNSGKMSHYFLPVLNVSLGVKL